MDVLLIEDEAKVVDFISKGLEEEGYAVAAAYNGKQGLDLLKGHKYDLVLLDLMLPEIDGLEVLRNMRARGHQHARPYHHREELQGGRGARSRYGQR